MKSFFFCEMLMKSLIPSQVDQNVYLIFHFSNISLHYQKNITDDSCYCDKRLANSLIEHIIIVFAYLTQANTMSIYLN